MKRSIQLFFASIALGISIIACQNDPGQVADDNEKAEKKPIATARQSPYDSLTTDSLRSHYSDTLYFGLYVVNRTSFSTAHAMPLEVWEKILLHSNQFKAPESREQHFVVIDRGAGVQINTAARPIDATREGDKWRVQIPIDGASSKRLAMLKKSHGESDVALIFSDEVATIMPFSSLDPLRIEFNGLNDEQKLFLENAVKKANRP